MTLEDRFAQHDKIVVDKYVDLATSYQMSTRDYVVRPKASGANLFITLPPVAEAKGRFYSIVCRGADAVDAVIIRDKDDSECWGGDYAMTEMCAKLLLYSDGLCWHVTGVGGDVGVVTEVPTSLAPTSEPRPIY